MLVVGHGNVDEYCAAHGMTISERYDGPIDRYRGRGLVLVTDALRDKNEYYYQKYQMIRRKIELVSIWHTDDEISDFLVYLHERETKHRQSVHRGRPPYGYNRDGSEDPERMPVVRRIFELRDSGATYSKIIEDPAVRHPDGRKLGMSTVQVILGNREKYEKNLV